MKKLNTAVNTIADHFAGFALSENLDTNTYTPEKGCLENLIRGSEIGYNSAMNLMHDIMARLRGKRRSYDGSEVADTSMQKDVEAIKKLQEQIVAYEQFIHVAKDVFKDRIGTEYRPRVKAPNPDAVKDTATAKEVDELLAQFKKVA